MKTNIKKNLKRSDDHYIQFTEEEMAALHIKPHDKFSCKIKDGALCLEKYVPVELELEKWDKETLIFLIQESCEQQLPVDDVITNSLTKYLELNQKTIE